jgi:hypothetical protein
LGIKMRLTLFLLLLSVGIACLVVGLFLTRRAWRADIPPFGRGSRPFQIALRPEQFATAANVPLIRALNFMGGASVLCALVVVAYDILAGVSARG